jgi:DNA-binding NarL/FixJ family response regulator
MNSTGARALIVEDDRSWQQIVNEILTDTGLKVEIVDNLGAAVARLRAVPHRLAVVDLSLGSNGVDNQDGLRVLDAVRRHDPGCATILLTGYATVELAVSALTEHSAFTCLRKEAFKRSEFREVIKRTLASTPPLDAAAHAPGSAFSLGWAAGETNTSSGEETPRGQALIVEDDAGWRAILSELLTDAGYQARLCASFGEALGRLRHNKFVVDLSLADSFSAGYSALSPGSSAQELDGYRLLASTRAGDVPTIVVSGVATPDDIEIAYAEQGIFACLEKQTFSRRVFLQTVEDARLACRTNSELDCLTPREWEVLELVAQGLTNKEIAETLVITTNTVKRHLKAVFGKLKVHTRSAAAARAVSAGVPTE